MWFSPLKGAHLTLGQLDKTLPVDISGDSNPNKKIKRGIFVYISTGGTANGTPRFALYTDAIAKKPNAVPYIALMDVNDFQAGMAGNVGQAPRAIGADNATDAEGNTLSGASGVQVLEFLNKDGVASNPTYFGEQSGIEGPRITAISVVQPAEYQTDAFEPATGADPYYVGCPLTVSENGKLKPFTDGENIVGYVTAVPKIRWINNLGASEDGARISGGNRQVIEFSTAWIPCAKTAAVEDDESTPGVDESKPSNIGMLSTNGAKAAVTADAKAPAPTNVPANAPASAGAKPADPKTLVK